jgi:hypothetical protein
MGAGWKTLLIVSLGALAACGNNDEQAPPEENALVGGGNIPANADIEALPADESSTTSSEELINGVDEPTAGETGELPGNEVNAL